MTFTYTVTAADWGAIAPELVLASMALLIMLVDLLLPHAEPHSKESGPANFVVLPLLSVLGVLGALVATLVLFVVGNGAQAFNHMIGSDQGSLYGYLIILVASGLGLLLSPAYLKRLNLVHQGEYYALFLLATVGMLIMAAATSFLTVFLGLEMLSLALYILCGFAARRKTSQEAGMKYFLLSSFASAFLLYGIALTYGATGNTSFTGIATFLIHSFPAFVPPNFVYHAPTMLLIAMGLLAVGFSFKISAIPFQAWTPDVYEGAPAPVTAFMSVGTKAAALIAFARVFDVAFITVMRDWQPIIWAIAILTIVGGNVLALAQANTKRLLAYSSIAHAGYLLIGVVVGGIYGLSAILFYLLCYSFMNLGAFGVVSMLERADNTGSTVQDLRGLWYRQPVLAGFLAFFLFALAGFPPMSGFAGKYAIFYAALLGGHPELLIIGVVASVLGMYYYLRIIATMFMEQQAAPSGSVAPVVPAPAVAVVAGKSNTARAVTGGVSSGRAATAVAVKPTARVGSDVVRSSQATEAIAPTDAGHDLNWMSWLSIGLAALGTLAMGTILPFWLVNVAQQAAQMMLK